MTTFDLDQHSAQYQIQGYQPGKIKVNGTIFTESIMLTPSLLIENELPQTANELTEESFKKILAIKPDILLVGTGETHVMLPITLYGHLINAKIGVEIMSTSAACRTFQALSAENRNVAAILIV